MVSMFFIFVIIDDIIMVLDKMLTMPMTARMLGKEEDLPKEGDVDAAVLALVRSSLIIMVVNIATKVLIITSNIHKIILWISRIQFVYKLDPLDIAQGILMVFKYWAS